MQDYTTVSEVRYMILKNKIVSSGEKKTVSRLVTSAATVTEKEETGNNVFVGFIVHHSTT